MDRNVLVKISDLIKISQLIEKILYECIDGFDLDLLDLEKIDHSDPEKIF